MLSVRNVSRCLRLSKKTKKQKNNLLRAINFVALLGFGDTTIAASTEVVRESMAI